MQIATAILSYRRRWLLARRWFLRLSCLAACALATVGLADDRVTFRQGEIAKTVEGIVQVEAQDGGLLLLSRDGSYVTVQPGTQIARDATGESFPPLTQDEMIARLRDELPPGFVVRKTPHYVIAYNTTDVYAKWCGNLYERVYRLFYNYWKQKGLELSPPKYPLVAIIFDDRRSFVEHGRQELGEAVESVVGYYSLESNRVTMYDLTGMDVLRGRQKRPTTLTLIQQMLSQPAAIPNVATIIHEATHQLAYNSGLQTRYADNPLWLSEGLALFFESPQIRNHSFWPRAGQPHPARLDHFRRYLPRRPTNSLAELITLDDRLRDPKSAVDAYAEAWALTYYLAQREPKPFAAYLGDLGEYRPLETKSPEERVKAFERHFGPLAELDAELLEFIARQ